MTEVLQKQAATLYKLPRFRTAFHNVILYSLRSNGYYDYRYISRSITRADVLAADTPASQLQYLTEISDQTLLHLKARGGDGETPSAAAGAVETGRV